MRKRHRALGAIMGALALWTGAPAVAQDKAQDTPNASDEVHAEAVRVWNELQEGVKNGTLTKAQAKERLDEYRASRGAPPAPAPKRAQDRPRAKNNKQQAQQGPRQPAQAKAGFDAAVRSGRLTQEEADEKWARWQRNYERRQAKAAGASSAEPGAASEAPQQPASPPEGQAPRGDAAPSPAAQKRAQAPAKRKAQASPELQAMREKLKAAVQNGDLTQDQARQRLVAYMRSQPAEAAGQSASGGEEELQAIMVRFQSARRDGLLSTEQALRFLEPL